MPKFPVYKIEIVCKDIEPEEPLLNDKNYINYMKDVISEELKLQGFDVTYFKMEKQNGDN